MPPPSGVTRFVPDQAQTTPRRSSALATPAGVTPNARVNQDSSSLSQPQVEPSITSNPQNRMMMVSGFADYISDAAPGVARSVDGGASWSAPTGGATLPNPPGLTWGSRIARGSVAGGDSSVSWSTGTTVYFSTLGFQDNSNPPTPNTCNVGGVYVYKSTDGGNTWTLPASGPAIANTQTTFRDKDYIAADSNPSSPHAGAVYMVWSNDNYSSCPQDFSANFSNRQIMFSHSTDGGATWSSPIQLGTGCLEAAYPAVASNGDVFVVWYDCNTGNREVIRRSTDGGAAWGAAISAASGFGSCPDPLNGSSFRVSGLFPAIATDLTNASNVYVVYPACMSGYSNIYLARSTTAGTTWTSPLRVDDDLPGDQHDQFFPWIAVADDGTVRVTFGDDRLDTVNAGGRLYDIFMAESTNHGTSFGPNFRVTSQSSDPDQDGFGGSFIGDYFNLAPCGTAAWTDTRNGNDDIYAGARDANGDGTADHCVAASVQDTDNRVTYNGWRGVADSAASGGSYRVSPTKNDSATFKFTGTTITWIARKAPNAGQATVLIDGTSHGTFDLYNSTVQSNVKLSFTGLASKTHNIVVKVTGTKTAASTGCNVAVDAFTAGSLTTQDTATKIRYDTWAGTTTSSANGGSYRKSTAASARVSLTFTGTGVDWIAAKGPSYGIADVVIDGIDRGTVDLYAASQKWNVVISYTGLSSGTHTIAIKPTGKHNPSSTANGVLVDAFVAH